MASEPRNRRIEVVSFLNSKVRLHTQPVVLSTYCNIHVGPVGDGSTRRDVPRILIDADLVTILHPERPRLGGNILTSSTRHIQTEKFHNQYPTRARVQVHYIPIHHGVASAPMCGGISPRCGIMHSLLQGTHYVRICRSQVIAVKVGR